MVYKSVRKNVCMMKPFDITLWIQSCRWTMWCGVRVTQSHTITRLRSVTFLTVVRGPKTDSSSFKKSFDNPRELHQVTTRSLMDTTLYWFYRSHDLEPGGELCYNPVPMRALARGIPLEPALGFDPGSHSHRVSPCNPALLPTCQLHACTHALASGNLRGFLDI